MNASLPHGWHTPVPSGHPAEALLSARAVRERCAAVMAWVEQGGSRHFAWHGERLPEVAAYVADTVRQRYPDLRVPYHSRMRHFEAGSVDRWGELVEAHGLVGDPAERARVAIDLTVPSVLLDAGAGPDWRYHDAPSGQTFARSEGLGVASLRMFEAGALSTDVRHPLRCDARALQSFSEEKLARAFQIGADNPLLGAPGRVQLLRALGKVVGATPAAFGKEARLGHLYDHLRERSHDGRIETGVVLDVLLRALGPVWPGRAILEGVPLGDCWQHPAPADGFVPFHKLTQWLAYSLLEPLAEGGLEVVGLDALTGLPEYRNGGLLLDGGLLVPRDPDFSHTSWRVEDEAIVEWRAVTVIALDRLADAVRVELGVSAEDFPLARVLEGGTWAAGRRLAAERRPGGAPPLRLISDGTVF